MWPSSSACTYKNIEKIMFTTTKFLLASLKFHSYTIYMSNIESFVREWNGSLTNHILLFNTWFSHWHSSFFGLCQSYEILKNYDSEAAQTLSLFKYVTGNKSGAQVITEQGYKHYNWPQDSHNTACNNTKYNHKEEPYTLIIVATTDTTWSTITHI
jgi:hypothetical protein